MVIHMDMWLVVKYLFHKKKIVCDVLICFAARNNIGVVIALWAPIILVWVLSFVFHSLSLSLYIYISLLFVTA